MENRVSHKIIGAAIEVHRALGGPGLLESVYEAALCQEFTLQKIAFEQQRPVPVIYKGAIIKTPLFIDVLVEGCVIVEFIPIQVQELIFLLRESPGLERSKSCPYYNMGKILISSIAGLWRAKKINS